MKNQKSVFGQKNYEKSWRDCVTIRAEVIYLGLLPQERLQDEELYFVVFLVSSCHMEGN